MERVKKIDQNLEFGYRGISFSIFWVFHRQWCIILHKKNELFVRRDGRCGHNEARKFLKSSIDTLNFLLLRGLLKFSYDENMVFSLISCNRGLN